MESTRDFECGACKCTYKQYTVLLEHLYMKHGTESHPCECGVRRWNYAVHHCHEIPQSEYSDSDFEEDIYCLCGETKEGENMIGCDGPDCARQWFHFDCVGVTVPPAGEWFCPHCVWKRSVNEQQQWEARKRTRK